MNKPKSSFFVHRVFLVIFLLYPAIIQAQENDPQLLSSPFQSLSYFLNNLSDQNYNPGNASKVFNPRQVKADQARNLSVELKQILDGRGIYIDLESVPNEPNYVDSTTKKSQYYFAPDDYDFLYLEKIGNNWYFSKSTVENIDKLHKEIFPYGTDKLLNFLPQVGNSKILGLKIWQYVAILFLVFFCYLVHFIIKNLLKRALDKLLIKNGYEKEAIVYTKSIVIPFSLAIIFQIVKVIIPIVQLSANISHYIVILVGALVPFFVTLSFYRIVDLISLHFARLAEKTKSTLDDQLVPLIRKSLKTFVVIIGVLFILQNLKIDIVPLLAGLSIGGLAFALAAQDTIKNFFGSLMIFIDKPFQVGHWITSGNIDGTVEEVGFRSTRIRTFRNSLVYVPNGQIANSTVDNHGLRTYRRFFTKLSLTYDTPPALIELFVEGLRDIVKNHPHTRKDYYEIHFNDMGASSLDIMFYIFFEVPSWTDELRCRHEVLISILKLAEKIGVNFAFPTQTLHVENLPGQLSLSPTYGDVNDLRTQMESLLVEMKKTYRTN